MLKWCYFITFILAKSFVKSEEQRDVRKEEIINTTLYFNSTFKLATYNLANFNNHLNWQNRKHRIAQELLELDPDIISLQEIRYDSQLNNLNSLTDMVNLLPKHYQYHWVPLSVYKSNTRLRMEGIGVMSKHRIIETEIRQLSMFEDDQNDRGCLRVTIEIHPNITIDLFNSHVTFGPKGQLEQLHEIVNFMSEKLHQSRSILSEKKGVLIRPQFFTGDTNIEFNSDVTPYEFLIGLKSFKNTTSDLIDTWIEYHYEKEGLNWTDAFSSRIHNNSLNHIIDKGFTYTSYAPSERLDMIFYRNSSNDIIIRPLSIKTFGQATSKESMPSDHLGLIAEFAIYMKNLTLESTLNKEEKIKHREETQKLDLRR